MDETGILLSQLTSCKVLVRSDDPRRYRAAPVNRTLITAIECIAADGSYPPPLIVWPAATTRSNWYTYPTPGWHFTCSKTGYINAEIGLHWIQHVFEPLTRQRAGGQPRILINDGLATHESLEVLTFCHDNNIILCRLPSHTSHKLQPCDIGVFGPLKTAYHEQVEQLFRGSAYIIGKQHFTLLYDRARRKAFKPDTIRSAWRKAGLFPFDPDHVLRDMQHPSTGILTVPTTSSLADRVVSPTIDASPNTLTTAKAPTLMTMKIEEDLSSVGRDGVGRILKIIRGFRKTLVQCSLLSADKQLLLEQNDEKKARVSARSTVVGGPKVMTYIDIVERQQRRENHDMQKLRKVSKSRYRRSQPDKAAAILQAD